MVFLDGMSNQSGRGQNRYQSTIAELKNYFPDSRLRAATGDKYDEAASDFLQLTSRDCSGGEMELARRSATILFIAAFVPLGLLGVFQISSTLQRATQDAESAAVARATSYVSRVDGELKGDLAALSVLAGAQPIRSGVWSDLRDRAVEVQRELPRWKNVILTDASAGRQVIETGAQPGAPVPARPDVLEFARSGASVAIGGFDETAPECGCVALHRRVMIGQTIYVLTVDRDVADFHASLLAAIEPGEIAALVDRQSLFIARTRDHLKRQGTPATEHGVAAVARGGSVVYSGITYEGLRNRTAYATSELSGWSVHIAVPSFSHNLLSAGYLTLAVVAFAASLLFAGAVTWFGTRDIAERRRAERARMQSQKLEAMGHLSGAVAHDFNNLLAAMVACLRLLGKSDDKNKRDELLQEGLSTAERGTKLVNQLLAFARDKPLELNCIDLEKTLNEIRPLLDRTLGPGIDFQFAVSRDARYVRTNATQLELTLLNFAVNARDAMPSGGSFMVSTRLAQQRGFVDVLVRDTGVGMPEEVARRAFEPFFTTKPEGKGTGFGLAQAHVLARDSGGSILLETAPGQGALFTLRLPVCVPESTTAALTRDEKSGYPAMASE